MNKISTPKLLMILTNLLSCYIILAVNFDFIPRISVDIEKANIDKINGILISIAYSQIAAYMFYWFTYSLPLLLNIRRSKRILAQHVHFLIFRMHIALNIIIHVFNIKKNLFDIHAKDLIPIDGVDDLVASGTFNTDEKSKSIFTYGKHVNGFANMPFNYPETVISELKSALIQIEKIKETNPNFDIDERFSNIISSIESNNIFEWYAGDKYRPFHLHGSADALFSLIDSYRKLVKINYDRDFRNVNHTIQFPSYEEYIAEQKKYEEFKKTMIIRVASFNYLRPVIMFSNENTDARSIIKVVAEGSTNEREQFIIYEFERNEEITAPQSSRCIIILTSGLSKKQIKKFMCNNKHKMIILVNPSLFFTSNIKFKDLYATELSTYKLRYKSHFKFLHISLNQQNPKPSEIQKLSVSIFETIMNYKVSPNK